MNDGPRYPQPLFHPSGEATDQRISFYFEADLRDHFGDARRNFLCGHFVGVGEVVEILPDFEAFIDCEEIGEVSDILLGLLWFLEYINRSDADTALCR